MDLGMVFWARQDLKLSKKLEIVEGAIMNPDDIEWLLKTIALLPRAPDYPPTTQRNIFRGCYDCWLCEQDRIDAVEIPKRRLAEAEELGLIRKKEVEYALTQKGREHLKNNGKSL